MAITTRRELKAVLFDRDGTLVLDVPYNTEPDLVRPVEGALPALTRLRRDGLLTGVVTNQSGVARGLITVHQLHSVNLRVESLLGPFDVWEYCPHGPEDACDCRKPRPGMILSACNYLGIRPDECAFVGDIGADMKAAAAAGSRGILVPTPVTRQEEIDAAPEVAGSLEEAVDQLLARSIL
ncbi:HAD-IIIA family hydrolase [Pseudarthrobacter sp. J75]|uniref:D-glycero-alpha-D-manno-heptose-1,7-bisphosphate 7-phosphatase n=1 Tax=unclassified Pseudarthrobacter TaxID=2647000 RepID=UPI002E81DC25|nr:MULTISPECIES: HAD-IIIA family hydrolase [unclassified Pseudarthrobacter]MEE2523546.1 HAD-IIIA family hydrolase [Pseudarthrobacter sp. J47]MEE2530528.1 HAD-IIIA family hydrolase [Pseudarthrobacter sp. J75]